MTTTELPGPTSPSPPAEQDSAHRLMRPLCGVHVFRGSPAPWTRGTSDVLHKYPLIVPPATLGIKDQLLFIKHFLLFSPHTPEKEERKINLT